MRIWFDLSNSPHINMFGQLIRELGDGNEVVITCRALANTVDLLDLHGLEYEVVGEHYGGRLARKIYGFPIRVAQLRKHLVPKRIDVAVSQSSFHSPVVARSMGVRSIYMNDNEHAMGNVPAFLCADLIMVPEYLEMKKLRRRGARPGRIVRYPGVKEGIYLWNVGERLHELRKRRPVRPRKVVYVRPEPWTAQYYKGARDFLDGLLLGLAEHVEVVLLPRGKEQGERYKCGKFSAIRIADTAIDIAEIARDCDLFIGAGGTMTREMAVLGVPTISVYQDELLDVDRYLLEIGAFQHRPNLSGDEALDLLDGACSRPPNFELLGKGRAAYQLLKETILR